VSYEGDFYYWEHLKMLTVPGYREAWQRKLRWYESYGFADRLIKSEARPNGGINASDVERIARARIPED
jgi:hypothetical protein